MHFKYDQNLLFLWGFLAFQILVLVGYLKFSSTWSNDSGKTRETGTKPIQFMDKPATKKSAPRRAYLNSDVNTEIHLKTDAVENYFKTVNNTNCFQFGTDFGYMKRNADLFTESGKCECLPGYHGNDCAFPEVIWRAFIALRRKTIIRRRRTKPRRLIHMIAITHPAQVRLATIAIHELSDVVDLFVVAESNRTEHDEPKPLHFKRELDRDSFQGTRSKILFMPIYNWRSKDPTDLIELSRKKSRKIIRNLMEDDLVMEFYPAQVPNPKALLFFKLYDGFTLPFQFRLKWNVYGYYYQHPSKTKNVATGRTVEMLATGDRGGGPGTAEYGGLTVGDLNHYGGWHCELCYDTRDILDVVQAQAEFRDAVPSSTVLDIKYLEQVIGDGLYIDGKTMLVTNHEGRDSYYSPDHVAKYYWKYDSLMINFYSRADYN